MDKIKCSGNISVEIHAVKIEADIRSGSRSPTLYPKNH